MNPQCEPPQFGLHVDSPVLIMDSNRIKILSPGSVFIRLQSIWCNVSFAQPWRLAAGGWRGSATRQTRWLAAHVQSKNKNTAAPRPRAMHGCLTSKTSSMRTQGSISNYVRHRPDQETKSTTHPRAGSQLPHDDTNYIEMISFSSLDDMRTIRTKVDEKAHDLFKEKPGQAPLTVTRILNSQEANAKPFEKDRKVLNLSDIKRLRNVRSLPQCVRSFRFHRTREVITVRTSGEVHY
jgi:hypothetical protein